MRLLGASPACRAVLSKVEWLLGDLEMGATLSIAFSTLLACPVFLHCAVAGATLQAHTLLSACIDFAYMLHYEVHLLWHARHAHVPLDLTCMLHCLGAFASECTSAKLVSTRSSCTVFSLHCTPASCLPSDLTALKHADMLACQYIEPRRVSLISS